ncbi:MAG: hypothetical protein IKC09_09470 [Oscillospiraceae bacterium]|nr:hypothetical protein [Oscillospiraceae bacterium]
MNEFLNKKTTFWYISCVSMVLALVGLIVYVVRGGNSYSPVSGTAVAVWAVGIVLNAVVLVKDFKIGQFIPYLLYVVTLGVLLNTEMLFASNVLVSIDGGFFDVAWIAFVVCLVLAIVAGYVASVKPLTKE